MKNILEKIFNHETLSRDESRDILIRIANGEGNDTQVTAFMTAYLMRSITTDELAGFRSALLELCTPVKLESENAIDLCGTGGDGKNTINISTLASFVVAGAGGKVIKHGNYGVSSVSGSSNVLEALGYRFTDDNELLKKSLDKTGICFLHAPLFHTALQRVAPIRKALGLKTFFNMLGPLVNPANPGYRMTGVFSLELARTYQYLAQETKEQFVILHNLDGYDEFSLTGPAKTFTNAGEKIISPSDFGLNKLSPIEIAGGVTVEESARLFKRIITNQGTKAQEDVVLANAALALQCLGKFPEKKEAFAAAKESLQSGKAYKSLLQLIKIQNR